MNGLNPKKTNLVKKALRKASLSSPDRNQARKDAKIAPSLFRCQCGKCDIAIYEGTSEANFEKLIEEFPDLWVLRGKGHIDHIKPVREGKRDQPLDWNDYVNSLFCDAGNLQYLSPSCHELKSKMDKG